MQLDVASHTERSYIDNNDILSSHSFCQINSRFLPKLSSLDLISKDIAFSEYKRFHTSVVSNFNARGLFTFG